MQDQHSTSERLQQMGRNVLGFLLAFCTLPLCALNTSVSPLHDGWRLQSACQTQADGAAISISGFSTDGWLNATVPGTVLAAQVADKIFPDPYFAMNLRSIPGATYPIGHNFAELPVPEDSPYHCGWWYRVEFNAPHASRDQRTTIHFGGINYRGDVWINGHRIADSTTVAGAYRTYDFDVTEFLKPDSANVLAVETFAPSDKDLGINWVDWNPAPPDKDMGLWGDVNLVSTGSVTLRSPMAVTHFADDSLREAELTVYGELHNDTGHAVRGTVSGRAVGVEFQQPVELAANEDKTVVFTPEQFPALRIHDPKPWWPNQMGEPHLERLSMSFSEDGVVSDTQSVDFGIREITSELTTNGSRLFRINGKPILIRGAGWSPDMLLRNDANRLRDQISLVRDMNLNTIRLEGKLETEDFFRLTDREGILVMLGWCCCDHWEHWKDWTPRDLDIAKASLHDQMLRLRSHASLLVWLNGSDNAPPANVERAYLQVEAETHWPNPILAAASAASTLAGHDGVKMTGPYDYVPPSYWYVDQHNGGNYGFNTETSPGPAIPSLASRQKFLSDPSAWPPTADWSYHNGGGEFTNLKVMDEAIAAMYRQPASAADYERMAQTMAYDSERAMFEAYNKNKYSSTGVIQWMLNNAWPSMIWHLYDYYLDADAGYFATKKACEPLHIQYSYDDRSIVVVNSTYSGARNLHARVQVHGIQWNELYQADALVNAAPDSSQQVFSIPDSLYSGRERIFFIDLTLSDSGGHIVSHNFYWVPYTLTTFDWNRTDYTHTPAERYADLSALANLPKAQVQASADIRQTADGRVIRLHLQNPSSTLAFQLSAAVRTPEGGLVAPVFWSDNWVELAPGESLTLTARLPGDAPATPAILVQGWNIASLSLTPGAASQDHKGE
jgi:exo-1,4-beta-D-glucosaminidase